VDEGHGTIFRWGEEKRMSRLKILIVDDEKYEAVLMEKCVDWQRCGFEIVGSAQSAREALALFTKTEPDIVLCDINMPVINGLELSRRMKEQRPDAHIIIVTGYRDFEYAKQAVEIGIEKYILKPVQAEELLKTAEKIQKEIAGSAEAGAAAGDAEQSKGELTSTAIAYIESNLSARGLSLKGRCVGGLCQRELSQPGLQRRDRGDGHGVHPAQTDGKEQGASGNHGYAGL
jgi:DNA-binding NarL/FixJ family response regulator